MIAIVVVSHSRVLGEAAVGLAEEMVEESARPRIEIAAGLDATTFGTDAAAVSEAVQRADSPDGVLLLVDLGSAILSAEMALEFVDPELAARVKISSAPLVEGLVAAVVAASTGATLSAVAAEAQRGLLGKQDHLGDVETAPNAVAPESGGEEAGAEIDVINPHGLHARPAAQMVALAASFDAHVTLAHLGSGRGPVDAASLSLVATLNARRGDRLRVAAAGPESEQAVAAIVDFAERGFDDLDDAPTGPAADAPGEQGRPGGSGLDLAVGPALVAQMLVDTSGYRAGDPGTEQSRSADAQAGSAKSLDDLATSADPAEAGIFAAQAALLTDPDVVAQVNEHISSGSSTPTAWAQVLGALAERFESLDDEYQRERAQDVRSVQRRMLRSLVGADAEEAGTTDSDHPQVLVTPELDAATAATLDAAVIVGVVTTEGGATGHGVIVARSRGIPILTGVVEAAQVKSGQLVAFDTQSSEFVVEPDAATQSRYAAMTEARELARQAALAAAFEPAVTTDGTSIAVLANVASAAEAAVAASMGAEGAGLVRTEVLFGASQTAPTVDEQLEAFLAIGGALGGRPITIRTWDVGGDKPLAYLPQPKEANPFLGERGLRLSRRDPATLHDQLVAVCQAARETAVKVMFPMVTTVGEVDWALSELDRAAAVSGGRPEDLQVGIMIEVPAAALRAQWLARRLDFVSIGTNDLTQYTLAAERGNGAVAALADSLDPAVLQLIAKVAAEVPRHVEVAVCGDLASQPIATDLLIGLGIDELSAVGPSVPGIKDRVRRASRAEAEALALHATTLASAADVRSLLG